MVAIIFKTNINKEINVIVDKSFNSVYSKKLTRIRRNCETREYDVNKTCVFVRVGLDL